MCDPVCSLLPNNAQLLQTLGRKVESTLLEPEHREWNLTMSPVSLMWATEWEPMQMNQARGAEVTLQEEAEMWHFPERRWKQPRGQKVDMAFKGCSRQNGDKKTEGFTERMEQPLRWPTVDEISHGYIGCFDMDVSSMDILPIKWSQQEKDPLWPQTYCCKPAEEWGGGGWIWF